MEVNLSIIGYENYSIDEFGIITNIKRNKIVKSDINHSGYHRVMLYHAGIPQRFAVHRLVADIFIDNPEFKPCVNHKDLNKDNNHYSNLEWVTHKENTNHALANGVLKSPVKLTAEAIKEIQQTKRNTKYLSEKFGVSKEAIKYWRRKVFVKESDYE